MENPANSPAKDIFELFSKAVELMFDLQDTVYEGDLGEKEMVLEAAMTQFGVSKLEIEKLMFELEPAVREPLYMAIFSYSLNLMTMTSIVVPLVPDKALNCMKMAAVRPRRPADDEAAIEAVFAEWRSSDLSPYKLSLGSSAELAARGIVISPSALRKRFEKTAA